jgi:hypothetical protein
LYVRANRGGRTSGLASSVDLDRRLGRILAEFSFWPLGWVLTFDDVPLDGAIDVSCWFEIGFHEKQRVTLSVPCQWALSPYPADFRSPDTIVAERARREVAQPRDRTD